MRIKVQAIVCDSCGKQTFEESEFTGVTIAGPDKDLNGKFDICHNCTEGLAKSLGMGAKEGGKRPGFKAFTKPATSNIHAENARSGNWSEDEVQILLDHYQDASRGEIGELIGRSPGSVYQKMLSLEREGRLDITKRHGYNPNHPASRTNRERQEEQLPEPATV